MRLTATLICYNSKADNAGNRYWAFRFIDHETGHQVQGTISGNDSNIYAILRHWNAPDDWDRSVIFERQELGKREFKSLTANWPYAGCEPENLAKFIRDRLAEQAEKEKA
jgi:hypothetical protein